MSTQIMKQGNVFVVATAFIVVAFSAPAMGQSFSTGETVYATNPMSLVYDTPNFETDHDTVATHGQKMVFLGMEDGAAKIQYPDGYTGYITPDALSVSDSGELTPVRAYVGATKSEVREILGPPKKINETRTARGTRQQWVYGLGHYVYFSGNEVTTIQRPK
jgi:hypothetical protein